MKKLTALVLTLTMLLSMLVIPMGVTAAELTEEERQANDALAFKTNFPIAESTGANAKLFMDQTTYNSYISTYDVNTGTGTGVEWVRGLDYYGLANVTSYESSPTGNATDTVTGGANNALIYKIDQTDATGQWTSTVNLTTKNGLLTWTVKGTQFVINPLEKAIKVYSKTNTANVNDTDLKERFESLNNPVLDVENGYYKSITVLASSVGTNTLTPTVWYEGGGSKNITGTNFAQAKYAAGDSQATGFVYAQSLTPPQQANGSLNKNSGGASRFVPITISGFDTSKKIDKISFKSATYGESIYIISAFGEADSIADILKSADLEDYDSVVNALNTVDAILEQNNITVNELTTESIKTYNELKDAEKTMREEKAEAIVNAKAVTQLALNGNSRLFIPYTSAWESTERLTYKDYLIGVDFTGVVKNPTGDFDTDASTLTGAGAGGSALAYTLDKGTANGQWANADFTTIDGKVYWEINGKNYLIDPTENVIKLVHSDSLNTEDVKDAAKKARFESLREATFNITDGNYSSFNFLAGAINAGKIINVELYYEGEAEPELITKELPYIGGDMAGFKTGRLWFYSFHNETNMRSNGRSEFTEVNIPTNSSKVLTQVKLKLASGNDNNCALVVSAWAEEASLVDILNSADLEDYDSVVNALNTVDAILAENNIEVNDLKDVTIAKYNALKAAKEALAVLTIDEIELENNTVTVNYTNRTAASVPAQLIVAQYNDNETELLSVKTYSVSFTTAGTTLEQSVVVEANNKVKVLIWKDLTDFFPLTANIYNN